jgi:hypothetical protein
VDGMWSVAPADTATYKTRILVSERPNADARTMPSRCCLRVPTDAMAHVGLVAHLPAVPEADAAGLPEDSRHVTGVVGPLQWTAIAMGHCSARRLPSTAPCSTI